MVKSTGSWSVVFTKQAQKDARKIARGDVRSADDLRAALLPLLPIQAQPTLGESRYSERLRSRLKELPPAVVEAFIGPASAQAAPGPSQAAPAVPAPVIWAVPLDRATLYSGPSDSAVAFGDIDSTVALQVLGYQGDWAHVYIPRTRTEGFVTSDLLAPSDPPSPYLITPPPAVSSSSSKRWG